MGDEDLSFEGFEANYDRELDILVFDQEDRDGSDYDHSIPIGGLIVDVSEENDILGIEALGFSRLDFSRQFRREDWKDDNSRLDSLLKEWISLRRDVLEDEIKDVIENEEPENRQDARMKLKGKKKELRRIKEKMNEYDSFEEILEEEISHYRDRLESK